MAKHKNISHKNTVRISRFYYLKALGNTAYVQDKATGECSPVFRKRTDIYKVIRYPNGTPAAEFNAICAAMIALGTADFNIIMREKKNFEPLFNKDKDVQM